MRIAHSKAFQLTKRKLHFQLIQGASILRMLEDWMGKENFKNGCRVSETALLIQTCVCMFVYLFVLSFCSQKYLKDYHFMNAKTANFWESLANVCRFYAPSLFQFQL